MWGKKIHLPRLLPRKTLRLVAGPAIALDDLREQRTTPAVLAEATDRIMDEITSLVASLRDGQPPRRRFDPRRPQQSQPPEDQADKEKPL